MTEELFPRGFAKAGKYSVHGCIYNVMWIMEYCLMHEERLQICLTMSLAINFLVLSVNLIPVPLSLTFLLMLLPHLLTLSTYHSHHP